MTNVGVVLPWFAGMCLVLFPAMGTTRIVKGRCLRNFWPNEAMAFVSSRVSFHPILLKLFACIMPFPTVECCNPSVCPSVHLSVCPVFSLKTEHLGRRLLYNTMGNAILEIKPSGQRDRTVTGSVSEAVITFRRHKGDTSFMTK